MVPTNSNCATKVLLLLGGSGLLIVALPGTGEGSKPCEVGSEERISAWFATGTWKTAQLRGTKSHLPS